MVENLDELEDRFEALFGVRLRAQLLLDHPMRGTAAYRALVQEAVDKEDYSVWSSYSPGADALTIS